MRLAAVVLATAFCAAPLTAAAQQHHHDSHPAGPAPDASQTMAGSGLSDEQRRQYLSGEGMGMAKPAELNHYPGPRHVLDLAEKLALSPEQLAATRALFSEVRDQAQLLGRQIVAREDELDSIFRQQMAEPERVRQLTAGIADLQGQLRALHLATHIRQRALLSAEQIARYDSLRNYVPGQNPAPAHSH